ncbi:MAG: NfeD family protein [Leptolyngbyaceae cyanobacterium MO_188.B28]|nr:NfeD family protein [Leptolyngbyaceae cyanobacterium MO_188.B28]
MNDSFLSSNVETFETLITGMVDKSITQDTRGRVSAMSTYWNAKFYNQNAQDSLPSGTFVRVIARQGNTLFVEKITE